MFSNLRYFAAISLVLVMVGAIALALFFRETKRDELVKSALSYSESTLNSYADTIWRTYQSQLPVNPAGAAYELATASGQFFSRHSIVKITIFSPDVTRLYYGSTPAFVTTNGTTRVTLFDVPQTQRGQIAARLLKNVYLTGSAEPNRARSMVQVILPLMKHNFTAKDRAECRSALLPKCQPDALAEMYVDVSEGWATLLFFQYLIAGTMIGTFALLFGMLLFTSWRAESIIAKQHEVNLELTAAAAAAEAQSRDKSQFLASISHELRTPLNAIIGFSEIIKTEAKSQLEKTYQDYVDDIHASGKHLLSLINDILDYSKAEAGKLQIDWAETDATKVIRNSLRMVMPRAEGAQVMLVEDIPSHHLVIVTDPKKLKQVLLNLLSNAVKFTPAGGEVRCQAWEDAVNKRLIVQVKDTGIGIAPKDISRVMTPFGQVDSTLARKYEGTGLGLPLSKKFVELMGGEFAIESELNVGTTITLALPNTPSGWQADRATTAEPASEPVKEESSNVTPPAAPEAAF